LRPTNPYTAARIAIPVQRCSLHATGEQILINLQMNSAHREPVARNDRIAPSDPAPSGPVALDPIAPDAAPISRSVLYSHLLTGIALILILHLRLLAALLAGLLVYSVINMLAPSLQRRLPRARAHWLVVAMLSSVVVGLLTLAIVASVAYLTSERGNPSALLEGIMPLIDRARTQLPASVVDYLPESSEEMRAAMVHWLRENTAQLQLAGKQAARILLQLLIGLVLGAMLALPTTRAPRTGPLAIALGARCRNLVTAFGNIVFAQMKISAVNTLLTGIYLLVVLPLFGVEMPLAKTLTIITFIVGLLPVVGNLISNTLIFVVGLSISLWVGVAALGYLIVIHKLEYFLNAGIVGRQIQARAWELIIAMLLMEAVFGIAGLIAAPIYYAYLKRELEAARLI
jgi:predicted PurR-regulated permease PerM